VVTGKLLSVLREVPTHLLATTLVEGATDPGSAGCALQLHKSSNSALLTLHCSAYSTPQRAWRSPRACRPSLWPLMHRASFLSAWSRWA